MYTFHICFLCQTACFGLRPICHSPSPNLLPPFAQFCSSEITLFSWIECETVQLFSSNNLRLSFSQNSFRLCTTLGPRQAVCQAQHSQGCYVFYKIVNFHLCWKLFSPRHLPTAYWMLVVLLWRGCRYSPQRRNSKFNVSQSMLGLGHARKIWWEGEKRLKSFQECNECSKATC